LAAVAVALAVFRMPPVMVAGAVADGLVFGWFRIAWIVVAAVFVYDLSVESGQFAIVKQSIGDISEDRRLQVLLIAFAFGALLEGAGGGGAPVAVTGAMMIGLGFPPFQTALLCLIANSAPVAYGGLGNPVRTLVAVTGLPEPDFSAMIGRILPLTDRKSTRLNSSHVAISYAVFCLKKKRNYNRKTHAVEFEEGSHNWIYTMYRYPPTLHTNLTYYEKF